MLVSMNPPKTGEVGAMMFTPILQVRKLMHGEGNLLDVTQQLSGRAGTKTHLSVPKHVIYLPLLRRFKCLPQDAREGERTGFSKASP